MHRSLITGLIAAAAACLLAPAGAQAAEQACGGPGQRACCFLERATACDAGFGPADLGQFPNGCGLFPAATCMPLAQETACGGEGQRACCFLEGAACQEGLDLRRDDLALDLFVPVSGDATCSNEVISGSSVRRSDATCIKANPAPIAEPVTGWSPTPEPRGIMRGYHDMHLHLLGHMAHGGRNVVGEPAPQSGSLFILDANNTINDALSPARDLAVHKNPYHGLLNDTSGDGTGDGARTEFGAPYFSGWPKWHSTTHQQTYHVWLERAWRGGLRTTTLFASHVESLCKTSLKATREVSWPICEDSMRHVVDQLLMAREFERFIDWQNGGPGLGWFRIVTTPQQARDVVRAGKLAVVLGIEVDNLFNCKESGCPEDFGLPAARVAPFGLTQPTTLAEAVDAIYAMGVRHVFPVHNFDNEFGAAATWMDPVGVGQAVAEQRWWVTRDCGDGRGEYGFWIDNAIQSIMLLLGFGVFEVPPIPVYVNGNLEPTYASCNVFGLRPMGHQLLQLLMNKGMLIDIDHMSSNSLDQTIAITNAGVGGNGVAYPVVASHVQAFDLHRKEFDDNKGRHERMRTRAQLDAIRSGGGMVAAMLKDDVQDTDLKGRKYTLPYSPVVGPAIADNCRHSSKTWAQLLQYTVDVMGAPVAMGSDWNGAAGHLGPRFGSDACGGWGAPNGLERPSQILENSRLQYPFTLEGFGAFEPQVTGFKTFDYNVDGLAHIGLVPDMIADLKAIGLNDYYVDKLMCSGEAYIRVWERAAALGAGLPAPDPNRPWLCDVTDNTPPESTVAIAPPTPASGWYNADVVATITASDADSGVEKIDYSVTAAPLANGPVSGSQATVTITGEGDRHLTYFATDLAGNAEAPNAATVRIDRTAPTIDAAPSPSANAAGWNNSAVTVSFTCADTLSGIDSCAAAAVLNAEGVNQSASGNAADVAGNIASASIGGINIDLTPPVVAVTGVSNGAEYDLNNVPEAGCSTSDALSGLATAAVVSVTGGTSNGVGTYVVSCTGASDRAGNVAAATASYVVHYVFTGFFSPIGNHPVVNAIKAGQTVPVKFGLGGNHGLDVLLGGIVTSSAIGCGTGVVSDLSELTVMNPGASQFTYDPLTSTYQFNWKTDRNWSGSCRRLLLRLDDGTLHTADFRLQ
jgi:microsomal dipeptidase-like Zn-dependent dipeptidase